LCRIEVNSKCQDVFDIDIDIDIDIDNDVLD